MAAKPGNKNAVKKGPKRVDVHVSLADERRAKVERWLREQDVEPTDAAIAEEARRWLYQWIDGLDV